MARSATSRRKFAANKYRKGYARKTKKRQAKMSPAARAASKLTLAERFAR